MTKEKFEKASILLEQIREGNTRVDRINRDINILNKKFTAREMDKELISVTINDGSEKVVVFITPESVLKNLNNSLYISENLLKRANLLFNEL